MTEGLARRHDWTPALVMAVPLALVLTAAHQGIGMSPDSDAYARPLLEGEFSNSFPIGLPLVLLAVGIGRGALAVNLAALVVNLTATYLLARVVSDSRWVALCALAWVSASVATTQVYSMLWSEPIFCAAVNCCLLALAWIVKTRRLATGPVVALIVCANIAGATRWALLFMLPLIGLVPLVAARGSLVRRLGLAAGVASACGTTVFAGIARNLDMGVGAMGPRQDVEWSKYRAVVEVARAAAGYGQNALTGWTDNRFGVLLLVLAAAVVVAWWVRGGLRWSPAMVPTLWVVSYTGALLASSMMTRVDVVGFRMSAPVFTSCIVALFTAASQVLPRRLAVTLFAVSLGWLCVSTSVWAIMAGSGVEFSPF